MKNLDCKYLMAIHSSFLFGITIDTNAILIDIINNEELVIWVYLDRKPTEDVKDVYYSVCSEITGDFINLKEDLAKVHFIVADFTEDDLKNNFLLYARCDYLDEKGVLTP